MKRRALAQAATAALAALLLCPPATAQTWPTRPVRLLIGQAPGGAVDAVARALADAMSPALGQPVVVDPRPGAAGMIAAETVAKSGADAHTIGLLDVGAVAVNPSLQKTISYDVARDFVPIGGVARIPLVLVAHPSAPFATLAELTVYAKANPDQLSYASSGVGSPLHLAFEAYKQRTGAEIRHVPYKGGAPALADVAAGHVPLVFIDANLGAQYTKSGRVKPLAIGTLERSPLLPDVPTFAESGLAGFESVPWVGVMAARDLPPAARQRLEDAVRTALADAKLLARIRELGFAPMAMDAAAFGRYVAAEGQTYRELIQVRGIRLSD